MGPLAISHCLSPGNCSKLARARQISLSGMVIALTLQRHASSGSMPPDADSGFVSEATLVWIQLQKIAV